MVDAGNKDIASDLSDAERDKVLIPNSWQPVSCMPSCRLQAGIALCDACGLSPCPSCAVRAVTPAAWGAGHAAVIGPQVVERTGGYSGSDMRDLIQVGPLCRCSLSTILT